MSRTRHHGARPKLQKTGTKCTKVRYFWRPSSERAPASCRDHFWHKPRKGKGQWMLAYKMEVEHQVDHTLRAAFAQGLVTELYVGGESVWFVGTPGLAHAAGPHLQVARAPLQARGVGQGAPLRRCTCGLFLAPQPTRGPFPLRVRGGSPPTHP